MTKTTVITKQLQYLSEYTRWKFMDDHKYSRHEY